MSPRRQPARDLAEVRARKRELIARSDVLRRALADHAAGLTPIFEAGDKVVGFGRALLAHPFLLVGAGALLVALFPRAVLGFAARGFALWRGAAVARQYLASRR